MEIDKLKIVVIEVEMEVAIIFLSNPIWSGRFRNFKMG